MVETNLQSELASRARRAALTTHVARALVREVTLAPVLHRCAATIAEACDLPFVRLWARAPLADGFVAAATAGESAAHAPALELDLARLAALSSPYAGLDLATDTWVTSPAVRAWAGRHGFASFAALPFAEHDQVVGVMTLFSRAPITDADLRELAPVADVLALAIARDRAVLQRASLEESLRALTYGVSHDLRAPARHVSGFVDLLRRHAGHTLDAKSARYVDTIADAAKNMHELIDALVAFSRVERAPLVKRTVDTERLVREVWAELMPRTEGRRVNLILTTLPSLYGDQALLRIAFQHLLANALKFSARASESVVEVGAEASAEGDPVVFVRDNGVGFDMAYAGKLFSPFQRLHPSDQFDGAGMGLATVRRIVARHGGHVRAAGADSLGATFFIGLPARPPDVPLEEQPRQSPGARFCER